ncbi:helix-turn-helix domain-containing protein [Vibrio salinus]|uniref:helix-turn-helix domain-containing protein n=1 Tax=Vibrio salinus TaxID=2899784 RepID=UPI001E398BA1|nr:AraC family transcriptional regulator [Vibrio salinus]MCE0494751.1 AraC family transcriptional regulator [Vibrio salinus]
MMNMNQTQSDRLPFLSHWTKQTIPMEDGNGFHETLSIDDNIQIVYSDFFTQSKTSQASHQEHDSTRFCMTYTLKGASGFHPKQLNPDLQFTCGERHSCLFQTSEGIRIFRENQRTVQYRIVISKPAYRHYGLDFLSSVQGNGIYHIRQAPISAAANAFLTRLNTLRVCNHLEKPLERKIIVCNLVSDFLSETMNQRADNKKRTPSEENAIAESVSFIENHYDQSISVAFLAQRSGITENRFRKLFQEIVHSSPYQFLLATRMEAARQLLYEGISVNQVAYKTGYDYPSNFSYMYKRYFGFPPKISKGK